MVKEITQIAKKDDVPFMGKFMADMAEETEGKKLDLKLVTQAVKYLFTSDYGESIVKRVDGVPVAALFLTFQNQTIWWISSVFVTKIFRGKRIFSQVFDFAKSLAQSKDVKYLRLYAQRSNMRAKDTYKHKGMTISNDEFYGYDLTLKNLPESMKPDKNLLIKRIKQEPTNFIGMIDICERIVGMNKGLGCFNQKEELIGYCEYFFQFSQWRFGLTAYISTLFIKEDQIDKKVLGTIFNYIIKNQDIKIVNIRIISKSGGQMIFKIAQGIQKLKYDILEIALGKNLPKL